MKIAKTQWTKVCGGKSEQFGFNMNFHEKLPAELKFKGVISFNI